MTSVRYQLVIVGAGSAGLASAALAAELGARVVLIERHRLGGDRMRYRVPAAAVIQAARTHSPQDKVATPASPRDDFATLFERARHLQTTANAESLDDLGIEVVYGEARFVAADAVEVAGRRLEFQRALIATGSQTEVPRRVPGLEDVAFKTPETLFELIALPRRLGVLGAGSRGCEMAQTFADLGSEVHLFAAGDRLLPERDLDAAEIVAGTMRRHGLKLHVNSRDLEIRPHGDAIVVALPGGRSEIGVDELLLATGPTPNVEKLGLEAAGVAYDLSGIEVDRCLRTTNRRIFAAGGVVTPKGNQQDVSPPGLAADADARMAVRNALLFRRLERRRRTVPRATYTRPEIARVGIGAEEAEASPSKIETLTVTVADADRSGLFGGEGFLRVHLMRNSGEVLGGTLVSDRAAELIGPLAMAVGKRMGLGVFAEIPLPHPTRSEIYRRAAFAWRRQRMQRQKARRQQVRRRSVFPWRAPDLIGLWIKITSRF